MVAGCGWQRWKISSVCGRGREKCDFFFFFSVQVDKSESSASDNWIISCSQVCVCACSFIHMIYILARFYTCLCLWLCVCVCVSFTVCVLSRWWLTVRCPVGRQKASRRRCLLFHQVAIVRSSAAIISVIKRSVWQSPSSLLASLWRPPIRKNMLSDNQGGSSLRYEFLKTFEF